MRVALAQISPKLSKDNIKLHIQQIKSVKDKADIIIFPELSLNGYLLMDRVYEDAFDLDEFEDFKLLSYDIDIILGCALKVKYRVFNSAIYFSSGEIKHIHYKNHLPNYGMFEEARFFFAGKKIEDFKTKFGKAMCVICEDMWNSKTIDKIAKNKPEVLYVIANSPTRDFLEDGELAILKKWKSMLKTTAILSGANIVFVNRVGFEDGLGFWGGSMIVGADGLLKHQISLFERELKIFELNKTLSNIQKYMLRNE